MCASAFENLYSSCPKHSVTFYTKPLYSVWNPVVFALAYWHLLHMSQPQLQMLLSIYATKS